MTSNPFLAAPENIFHPVPTPQTPFSTPPMSSKHISPSANTSNPLFNSPHSLKTYCTQCQHLKPDFQLRPCPQKKFLPVLAPQTTFAGAPMPSKHTSPTSNARSHFSTTPCPHNIFHPVPTRQTTLSGAPMPSQHISPGANTSQPLFNCPHTLKTQLTSANTSNPLFNFPHALKTHFTQCQHLKSPFQLPPCPQNICHPVPTP